MARITVTSSAAGSAGVGDLTTKLAAVDTAIAAAEVALTVDLSAVTTTVNAVDTAVSANVVVDIDLAAVTNLNKLKTALAAIYNQVVQSGKITN